MILTGRCKLFTSGGILLKTSCVCNVGNIQIMDSISDMTNSASNPSIPAIESLGESWWPYIISTVIALISIIRTYMGGQEYRSNKTLEGKVVIITGANSGIGFETAKELAGRGAQVILACRNVSAAEKAAEKIRKKHPNAKLEVKYLDLLSLESITDFVHQLDYQKIDILINNAGVAFQSFKKSSDGFESHFATNYLGHFMLTRYLIPRMQLVPGSRVISVTSRAHVKADLDLSDFNLEINYSPGKAFAQSKLCLILMTRYLAKHLNNTNINFLCVNPGLVRGTKQFANSVLNQSKILRASMVPIMWLLMKSPRQGAQSVIFAVLDSSLEDKRGVYISDGEIKEPSDIAKDDKLAAALFNFSLDLVTGQKSPTCSQPQNFTDQRQDSSNEREL